VSSGGNEIALEIRKTFGDDMPIEHLRVPDGARKASLNIDGHPVGATMERGKLTLENPARLHAGSTLAVILER
jgi:hypothetical protein